MPYCSNCGKKLKEGAKYCTYCGEPCDDNSSYDEEYIRKEKYAGKIIKCPNCGEMLKSFEIVCPACGFEIRESKTTETIQSFASKLEQAQNEEQYIKLIRNFPIPNTKEDILEFMILASTNMKDQPSKNVFDAWSSKFEQCYQKAKLSFDEKEFIQIKQIYDDTMIKTNKDRIVHGISYVIKLITDFIAMFPNPVFGIVVLLLLIYEMLRLLRGDFAGLDIMFDALILGLVYRFTTKNKR
ncbi:MAG: zinc ribbon domain-containing protein [Erysipelotrichaceae bacterium]|nr:zinc ribbon domain-containing protein [Erysipelotrichaceae bacterium]